MRKGSDDFQAFLDDCWTKACETTKFTSESQCPAICAARVIGKRPLAEGLTALDAADGLDASDMMVWIGYNMLGELDKDLRLLVLRSVCRTNVPLACFIYREVADLSDEEDAILWAAFAERMPFMAGRFQQSPELRAKARV